MRPHPICMRRKSTRASQASARSGQVIYCDMVFVRSAFPASISISKRFRLGPTKLQENIMWKTGLLSVVSVRSVLAVFIMGSTGGCGPAPVHHNATDGADMGDGTTDSGTDDAAAPTGG